MKTKDLIITLRITTTEEIDVDGHVARSIVEDVRDGKQNEYIEEVTICSWGFQYEEDWEPADTEELKDYLTKYIALWNDTPWQLQEGLIDTYRKWCKENGLDPDSSAEYHLKNLGAKK